MSDLLSMYVLYQGWRGAKKLGAEAEFCRKKSLNEQDMAQIEDQRVAIFVSLVDARLVYLDHAEKSALRTARLRSSAREFFDVPQRYQTANASSDAIRSVIARAFYPKLLVREGKHWKTVSINQHVNIAWNATNRNGAGFPRWTSFYQATQTKGGQLNVHGTSVVPESALLLFLGQAEFRIYSGVVKIDGSRIQMAVRDWKSLLAMKMLRDEISSLIEHFLRNPYSLFTEREETWFKSWLATQSTE